MGEKPIIHDLDILRPEPEYVKLGGHDIDISFIPSGIALDIMNMRGDLEGLTDTPEKIKKIERGGEAAKKTFEITAEICAKITEAQYEEMNKDWLLKHTSVVQLKSLIEHITQAMYKSLEAGGVEIENPPAAVQQN